MRCIACRFNEGVTRIADPLHNFHNPVFLKDELEFVLKPFGIILCTIGLVAAALLGLNFQHVRENQTIHHTVACWACILHIAVAVAIALLWWIMLGRLRNDTPPLINNLLGEGSGNAGDILPIGKMLAASTAFAEVAPVSRICLSQAVAIALDLLLKVAVCRGLVAGD